MDPHCCEFEPAVRRYLVSNGQGEWSKIGKFTNFKNWPNKLLG